MSRQPRIDTSVRRQVYSFVETPIELNPPGAQSQRTPAEINTIQGAVHTTQPPNVVPIQHDPQLQQDATDIATRELEQARQLHLQERQAHALTGAGLPQHPALSAPYVEENAVAITTQTTNTNTPIHPTLQYQSPPYTPSLPQETKQTYSEPVSPPTKKVTVVPDTNPLQSPRSPIHHVGNFLPPPGNQDSQFAHENFPDHQPGQIVHPNQVVQGGHWSTGLFECADIGTCCLGLTCPCILYGRTQYRLLRKSRGEDPTNLLGYEMCNGSCTSLAVLCGCQWILATIQHTRTRKAYDIEGNICSDCVRASCCMCCTFIRNEREIRRREESRAYSAQLSRSTFVTPYQPPGQMQYQPNRNN